MDTLPLETKPDAPRLIRLNAAQIALVRDRLNDRSVNITRLAKEVGVSRAMLYYVTRGQSSTTPETLEKLAVRLNIDPKIIAG